MADAAEKISTSWRQCVAFTTKPWLFCAFKFFVLSCVPLTAACSGDPSGGNSASNELAFSTASCLPEDSAAAQFRPGGEVTRASQLAVYIDGSQSMSGFNSGATRELRPLGDLLNIIERRANEYETATYFAFGKNIRSISSVQAKAYGTTVPYNCRAGGCDNQESRLDNVLQTAIDAGPSTLSVVISDLWLDNRAFSGSPQVALGQPLQRALQEGLAIGVIGIKAPFDGAVYDVPGIGTYKDAKELPLYVLGLGPEEDVATLFETLAQSGSPSFKRDRIRYSLFSVEPNNPMVVPNLKAVGLGAQSATVLSEGVAPTIPQYRLKLGLADTQGGQLGRTFDIDATLRPGLVWQGRLAETTTAWRLVDADGLANCRDGTWQRNTELSGLWKPRPDGAGRVTYSFGAQVGRELRPDNIYYLEAALSSSPPASPNDANVWMREWSLDAGNAASLVAEGETSFKTLNLADLAEILEQELSRRTSGNRQAISFGFILKVER